MRGKAVRAEGAISADGERFKMNRPVAVGSFEQEKLAFFQLTRQILQSKSGIFSEKFNKVRWKKDFFTAKASYRSRSNIRDTKKLVVVKI